MRNGVVELHTRLFEAVLSAKGGRVSRCGFCFLSFLPGMYVSWWMEWLGISVGTFGGVVIFKIMVSRPARRSVEK